MARSTTFVKAALVTAFALCFTTVTADHAEDDLCPEVHMASGPMVADTLITSYISVDGNGTVLCSMRYSVPVSATLYQGMIAASQQLGNMFMFESEVYPMLGHFITSINDVTSVGGFYWFLFDKATLMTTPVGVDSIDVANDSSYIWHYDNSTDHNQTYTGPCEGSSVIAPTMPLTYKVAYLSVSSVNADLVTVCKQLVLIPASSTTAFTLLKEANDQVPISVRAVLHMQNKTVTSFNGVANDGRYVWTGYRAGSNEPIPYDLAMTAVSDGDHIEFRFVEPDTTTGPRGGAPSIGQPMALLSLAVLSARAMTSM